MGEIRLLKSLNEGRVSSFSVFCKVFQDLGAATE